MSNGNVQWLNVVLLLTERNKVHPLAEDEWVDAVIETAALANETLNFMVQRLNQGTGEKTAVLQVSACSGAHWAPVTWLPIRAEDLQRKAQIKEALLVSKHKCKASILSAQVKSVWDAVSRANVS